MAKQVQGEVRVARGGTSIPLRAGEFVQERDQVIVGATSSVGITLKDETLISLGPDSALRIDGFAFDPKSHQGLVEVSILRGAMRYVTGLVGRRDPKAIKVQTHVTIIGIRGTDFIVEVGDAK